jgi:hypothetical protein
LPAGLRVGSFLRRGALRERPCLLGHPERDEPIREMENCRAKSVTKIEVSINLVRVWAQERTESTHESAKKFLFLGGRAKASAAPVD